MNVGEVAAAAGISVRTLHHWDAVGLLVPSGRTAAGYRTYDAADLERLQQVLTYRELGFGLEDVRRLLDDPDVDGLDHLRRQQSLLANRISRLQTVAALVSRAVEARSMGIELDPHELREVFGDEDPTQFAEEARERWGDTDVYAQSHARTSSYSKDDWLQVKAEGEDVERRFAEALAAGLPVVLPTDTVYGVAVEPTRAGAPDRLFAVKQRPRTAALPLLVASLDQAAMLAGELPSAAVALAEAFWPGGLTLVVPRRPGLDLDLGGEDDTTVGLRLPDHPVPVALAERVGPLAATSANLHGRPTPAGAVEVARELGDAVGLVLDGGPCRGAPSTVVACTPEGVTEIREGRVATADVLAAIG